jgi:hypothetical protein
VENAQGLGEICTWCPGEEYLRPRIGSPEGKERNTIGPGEEYQRPRRGIPEAKEKST